MTSSEIRRQFIDFFREKGHTFEPSALVVPHDDPTLLFTNAGMNQFKDVFLGTGTRKYTRAVNTQKCIRAGGKHNDLDDVGHDTYHHTFFEMLGNWSFGDYFKAEAIEWAWELLVERWGLEADRLHATYFEGDSAEGLEPDIESRDLWLKILPPERVHPGGKKDNFWEMGETGPCGPCSEIHIDLTPDKSGASLVNAGDARVMEIWNLVFIQFNRDAAGKLTPLPAKHVDTGMGFERVTALLQKKTSNYDTDIFTPIFDAIREVTGVEKYTGLLESNLQRRDRKGAFEGVGAAVPPPAAKTISRDQVMKDVAYRVIADHLRCLVFAITDGATLSNVGRGYVLRRILRRAVRYGRQYFDAHDPFLHKLVPSVVETMCQAFPELKDQGAAGFSPRDPSQSNAAKVAEIIHDEEESFCRTYERGVKLFEEVVEQIHEPRPSGRADALMAGDAPAVDPRDLKVAARKTIPGDVAFKLHDTYGFPIDLTELMAEERGLNVDLGEYDRLMEQARDTARGETVAEESTADSSIEQAEEQAVNEPATDGAPKYREFESCSTKITHVCRSLPAEGPWPVEGEKATLILSRSPFYVEQGGQVGDTGQIITNTGKFDVQQVKRVHSVLLHSGVVVNGSIKAISECQASVEQPRRDHIMQNHTSTHIMNWALREVLGNQVDQKGSLVDPEKTRFDFSHRKAVSVEEVTAIEAKSNKQIEDDLEVFTKEVPEKEARKIKTLRAVFGEKYPETVRVVSIGKSYDDMIADPENPEWLKYSVEFCGGTHLQRSGEAELFRIIEETSVAKGIRRITAVTGERAKKCDENAKALLEEFERVSGAPDAELAEGLNTLRGRVNEDDLPYLERVKLREMLAELHARVKKLAKKQASSGAKDVRAAAEELLAQAETVGASKVIVGELPEAGPEQIREALDYLRTEAGSAGICVGCTAGEKVLLFASLTDDLVKQGLKAGDLIKKVAPLIGGGGGGKPQLAQAGGKNKAGLTQALETARDWLKAGLQPGS